jgi:adenylate kinase family enzyme
VYGEETCPLVDYYTKAGKLVAVDGEGTVEEIAQRLRESVRE